MKRMLSYLAGLALLIGTGSAGARDVDADPGKAYIITPGDGNWLICVASYTGKESRGLAHEFALEIRKHYQLPAFIYNHSDKEQQEQREQVRQKREQLTAAAQAAGLNPDAFYPTVRSQDGERRYLGFRGYHIPDQYAVLAGGYKDMESARKALDGLRRRKVPREWGKFFQDVIHVDRIADRNAYEVRESTQEARNPFFTSFVARNPTVPRQPEKAEDDPGLRKINEGEDLSVYKCPKPWTLVVAVFRGPASFERPPESRSFMDKLLGRNGGEMLAAAGLEAHNMAETLRKLGIDAYVLHTRHCSVVTVGGYDRKDDREMAGVAQMLASRLRFQDRPDENANLLQSRLMAQFMPMEVPR